MNTYGKLAIGVSIASGALLAAWLFTGPRKEKTRKFITKGTATLKKSLQAHEGIFEESEVHYV